jgi:peroxiredoxin
MMEEKEKPVNLIAAFSAFLAITTLLVVWSLKQNSPFFESANQAPVKVGLPAPDFTFPGLDGKKVSLSDYRGKVVFVNIWATWCPPCVEEMPSMQKLYQKLKGENFEILAVSIDSKGAKVVAPFMKKYQLTFPALIDYMSTIKRIYKTTGVPESYIIDKDGILAKKVIGPLDWSQPDILRLFRDLIEKPQASKG